MRTKCLTCKRINEIGDISHYKKIPMSFGTTFSRLYVFDIIYLIGQNGIILKIKMKQTFMITSLSPPPNFTRKEAELS